MTLQKAWDELKDLMERGIEEGKVCGYDTPSDNEKYGMYKVYNRVLDKMNRLEKEIK